MVTQKAAVEILKFCGERFNLDYKKLPDLQILSGESMARQCGNASVEGGFTLWPVTNSPVILVSQKTDDLAWVITHEFVHFLQYLAGDLVFSEKENCAFFKGKKTTDLPYYSRPEERDARERGGEIWRLWNRNVRNR